jgi:hypothetical protein
MPRDCRRRLHLRDHLVGNNNTGATLVDVKAIQWDPAHGMRPLQDALLAD